MSRIEILLLIVVILLVNFTTISALPEIITDVEIAKKTNTGMVTDAFTLTRKALEVHHLDFHAWTDVNVMDTTI